MHLNTLAGRSYNDLMQYPIFPWILADYDSEELDLTDSSTFRDFGKPMGAQSPERLLQFKKRYGKYSSIMCWCARSERERERRRGKREGERGGENELSLFCKNLSQIKFSTSALSASSFLNQIYTNCLQTKKFIEVNLVLL